MASNRMVRQKISSLSEIRDKSFPNTGDHGCSWREKRTWTKIGFKKGEVDTESTLSPTAIHFIIQEWNTLKNFPTLFHMSEKIKCRCYWGWTVITHLSQQDSNELNTLRTQLPLWSSYSTDTYARIFSVICKRMFITVLLKVYFIIFFNVIYYCIFLLLII